jgi:hypothetical protein
MMNIRAIRISKANILTISGWESAFGFNMELIGATILKTNLKIRESKNSIMIVGKTKNRPFNNVLTKNDLVHNLFFVFFSGHSNDLDASIAVDSRLKTNPKIFRIFSGNIPKCS